MSFGGLFDDGTGGGGGRLVPDYSYGNNAGMPPGAISQPLLVSQAISKSIFSSPGLSLGLQTNLDGQGDRNLVAGGGGRGRGGGAAGELDSLRRNRDEENESRSGSDNLDGVSGDEEPENSRKKKKRYHRHTPQQIQELEGLFKECPHPDEKQRADLSRRLNLENRQVKFWFQNRRTQMKTQMERHENNLLRQENDKLRAENLSIRDAMRNPMCNNCGGAAVLGEISLEEQHLRIENARLKDELERVCSLAGKFLGKPLSALANTMSFSMPNSALELAVGSNSFAGMVSLPQMNLSQVADFASAGVSSPLGTVITPARNMGGGTIGGAMFLEIALAAMEELTKLVQIDGPLWMQSLDGGSETLNYEEYNRFPRCIGPKPIGFVSESTRETGVVLFNSLALIDILMDPNRWAEMFPSMISRSAAAEVISCGMGGTRNGTLQLMQAELQVLSPLVPIRDVHFIRFCKQLAEGLWAIVDVSVNGSDCGIGLPPAEPKCRRLPSGCVVQDMQNGYSKVTWVEHVEYDEAAIHPMYRPLFRTGAALGARRWIATLQRQCQSLVLLMSHLPVDDDTTITTSGRRSMLKLAQRMTDNFCSGVCASSARQWSKLSGGVNIGEDVRVMMRQSVADPGEPPGVVLSAATSVWLAVPPQQLFDFLRDEKLRSEWDILSNGGPMEKMNFISKGHGPGNEVCLLRANAVTATQSSMLILQETCTDASGSLVVYAPVDTPAMHLVMSGGDSAYVALLPSGFAILPDCSSPAVAPNGGVASTGTAVPAGGGGGGSLLTVAFQILVNSQPTAKLTMESVETVNNLISCTVQKIKSALNLAEN